MSSIGDFPKPGWITLRPRSLPFSFKLDRRAPLVLSALTAALLLMLVLNVVYGDHNIAPADVLRAILGIETHDANHLLVVRAFRLPRILLATLIGAALAASGAIIQGITRNDLADPGLLGINSGAGVFVVGYLAFAAAPNMSLLPWLALMGALEASAAVYALAWKGNSSTMRMILIGVGLARLLKPGTGKVLLDGKAIHSMPTKEPAKQMGILPQGPVAPEGLTVYELVAQGRYPHQGFFQRKISRPPRKSVFFTSFERLKQHQTDPILQGMEIKMTTPAPGVESITRHSPPSPE